LPLLAGFPLFGMTLAGISPRRATDFLASPRKSAKKATRHPRSAFGRLPCAAPIRRPARNSPFGLKQPRRKAPPAGALLGGVGTGFSDTPSLYGNGVGYWLLITCLSGPLGRADWRVGRAERGLRMFEPEGRVCEDPARRARKEGTPEGGATAGYVSLPSFLSYNKKEGRPPGASPRPMSRQTPESRPTREPSRQLSLSGFDPRTAASAVIHPSAPPVPAGTGSCPASSVECRTS